MRKIDTPTTCKPDVSELFWYVDKKCFDRSGWEELEVHNVSKMHTNEVNMNNIHHL